MKLPEITKQQYEIYQYYLQCGKYKQTAIAFNKQREQVRQIVAKVRRRLELGYLPPQ
ncbi:MAG TPA: hypothetical protein VK211_29125 [Kamptonema sp.]|nr:hypothetical protein [Kamptonema sp.]